MRLLIKSLASSSVIRGNAGASTFPSSEFLRILNSHATSSRLDRMCTVACSFFIAVLRRASFSATVSPAYFTSRTHTSGAGRIGRSSQTSPARSSPTESVACFSAIMVSNFLPWAAFTTRPSKPKTPPSGIWSIRYSSMVGTPSSPIAIRRVSWPSSSFFAWTKYLPSVHMPEKAWVITMVPAEPVKPDRNARHLK